MMVSPQKLHGGYALLQRAAQPVVQVGPLGGRVTKVVLSDYLGNHMAIIADFDRKANGATSMKPHREYAIWIGISLLVLATLGGWYGFVDRAVVQTDRDGWHLRFSYVRMACHVCTGGVEELTWQGQPVPVPHLEPDTSCLMLCSVGTFSVRSTEQVQWHREWDRAPDTIESKAAITGNDLARGYYDYSSMSEIDDVKQGPPYY
jgi:hypothetical protein